MAKSIRRKLFASVLKLFIPAILLVVLAAVAGAVWLVHRAAANPPRAAYLVTPERIAQFTTEGRHFADETWSNLNNTESRGWLVRGKTGAPAVVLLHRYGADRSWLLNLGMRLNEATDFTVLIPDLRGHGEQPTVNQSSFGGCEADDLAGAIAFLNSLKNEKSGEKLTNQKIGVYGVEAGAVAAMLGAANSPEIAALALDSVPASAGDVLATVVGTRASIAAFAVEPLAYSAAPLYFAAGCYKNTTLAEIAPNLSSRKILLLAGDDAAHWQQSTIALANSFGNSPNVQKKTDLKPSGYNLLKTASSDQQEAYNKIVIEFFRASLNQ